MTPVQCTASPPAGITAHWRTGLPLPTVLLPPSLWWFKDLGQSELFHCLLYAAPVILLSSTRKISELVKHEFFQFCKFFWLLNLWESRMYWAGLGMWFSRCFHISGYPHEPFISLDFILFHISTSICFLSFHFSFMSFTSSKNCKIFCVFFFFTCQNPSFYWKKSLIWNGPFKKFATQQNLVPINTSMLPFQG